MFRFRSRRCVAAFLALLIGSLVVLPGSSASAATPAAARPAAGKHYIVGTDTTYAPFEFRDGSGKLVGIDMDLLQAIADEQGFTIEIKSLGFSAAVQALQASQVDAVMAGMSITDKRKLTFDFTESYFQSGIQLAVSAKSSAASYDDLKSKTIAVKTGTEGATYADSIKSKYGFTTTAFSQTADMIADVTSGNAVGYFDDYPVVAYSIQQGNGMKMVGTKVPGGDYGMAVNKNTDPELIAAFNQGLSDLKANGTYAKIIAKYLGDTSVKTQSSFFGLLSDSFPVLMQGLALTIAATALAIIFALVLGITFGLFTVSSYAVLRWITTGYVAIFRGTPLLVQVFFFYFGIPAVTGLKLDAFTAGVLTLSLNAGAYTSEIVRGGIQSVDPGQMEASRSLGLSRMTSMRKVVVPQAIKIMTPSFINQFIITLKDTSLLAVIGFAELTYQGQQIIAGNYRSFEMWLIIGAIYFILIAALTTLSNELDKKVNK